MSRRSVVSLLAALPLALATLLILAGCGFQLRGAGGTVLPAELAVMRVTMPGGAAWPPLLVEVREALRRAGGVRLSDEPGVPALTFYEEFIGTEMLATDSSGRASDYLINYRLSFALFDAGGKEWLARQSIKLQRDYRSDRLNALAGDREAEYLRGEMRRDAVQQLLRRLSVAAR